MASCRFAFSNRIGWPNEIHEFDDDGISYRMGNLHLVILSFEKQTRKLRVYATVGHDFPFGTLFIGFEEWDVI